VRNARFLGTARTKEPYALYADNLPYVIRGERVSPIRGEVYAVNGKTLEALDRLEGHPTLYRRENVDVLIGDGRPLRAWVYFYPERRGTLIESGNYGDDVERVRYRVGNIGDLLKHSWLIEILTFLKKQKAGSPFRYADTFSGFDEYPVGQGQAERIRKRLYRSLLFRIQKDALSRGRYYGSVSIARRLLGPSARLEVFDRNPQALACFRRSGIGTLKIKWGYDVLKKKKPFDLIFLDPYDDFLDEHEEVLAGIRRKSKDSSIFLFFPFRHRAHEKAVLGIIGPSGSGYIHGSIGKGDPQLDGIYRFTALFFPARHIDGKACRRLARRLGAVTERIRGIGADG
jgi:gamma-glutamylcyclotransferase (GGCT)/AIG2-like uncharacterized protein YtfP